MTKLVRWKLVVKHLYLCEVIAARVALPSSVFIREELVWGPGLDALIRCSRSWKSNGTATFKGYAWRSIARSMIRYLEERKKKQGLSIDDVDTSSLCMRKKALSVDVYSILKKVNRFDQLVLVLRYWKGLSLSELGRALKCSDSTACIYVNEALEHCRDVMSQNASLAD